MNIEVVGAIAGALSCITFVPQIFRTYRTKSVKDVSLYTFLIVAVSTLIWLYYGFAKDAPSIIGTNIIVFLSAVAMIAMKLIYGNRQKIDNKIDKIRP